MNVYTFLFAALVPCCFVGTVVVDEVISKGQIYFVDRLGEERTKGLESSGCPSVYVLPFVFFLGAIIAVGCVIESDFLCFIANSVERRFSAMTFFLFFCLMVGTIALGTIPFLNTVDIPTMGWLMDALVSTIVLMLRSDSYSDTNNLGMTLFGMIEAMKPVAKASCPKMIGYSVLGFVGLVPWLRLVSSWKQLNPSVCYLEGFLPFNFVGLLSVIIVLMLYIYFIYKFTEDALQQVSRLTICHKLFLGVLCYLLFSNVSVVLSVYFVMEELTVWYAKKPSSPCSIAYIGIKPETPVLLFRITPLE